MGAVDSVAEVGHRVLKIRPGQVVDVGDGPEQVQIRIHSVEGRQVRLSFTARRTVRVQLRSNHERQDVDRDGDSKPRRAS